METITARRKLKKWQCTGLLSETAKKKFLTGYWFAEKGTSEGPEWFQTDCIGVRVTPLIIQDQFRIFRGPLFHRPVTGQELLICCFLQQTGSSTYVTLGFQIQGCWSYVISCDLCYACTQFWYQRRFVLKFTKGQWVQYVA